jgi:hypothetical protein
VRDGSIDSVVATFPSEFIVDPGTMEEVRRVLRPSGRLVVAVWARLEGGGVLARLVRGLYAATGQNEPAPDVFKPWLERVGLSPQVVWEQVGRSTVMLVVAEKETDV